MKSSLSLRLALLPLVAVSVAAATRSDASPVTAATLAALADQATPIAATIHLRGQLDLSQVKPPRPASRDRGRWIASRLAQYTREASSKVRDYLATFRPEEADGVTELWLTNSLRVHASPRILSGVLKLPDVNDIVVDSAGLSAPFTDGEVSSESLAGAPVRTPAVAWGVEKVRAPELWRQGIMGQGVVVALIDSGVNYRHPDLWPNLWRNPGESGLDDHGRSKSDNGIDDDGNGFVDDVIGWNFEAHSRQILDFLGHGSASAGIIAGNGAEGEATGVAPRAKIMALQVGAANGPEAMEVNIWEALEYAIRNGARVVSLSMTLPDTVEPDYPLWVRAGEVLLAAGIVHINSAGNTGLVTAPHRIGAPASNPPPWSPESRLLRTATITIGATDSGDQARPYTSFGTVSWLSPSDSPFRMETLKGPTEAASPLSKPDLCAPSGVPSLASRGTGYVKHFGGTSAAAPHVAGAVALLLSALPSLTPSEIAKALLESAVGVEGHRDATSNDPRCGFGRIDVAAALDYLHRDR